MFAGRRILVICPQFFGYDVAIAAQLEALGAHVTLFGDRPSITTASKIAIRLSPRAMTIQTTEYVDQIVEATRGIEFDDIFVERGEAFTVPLLRRLFSHFPRARKILYLWDSFKNAPEVRPKLPLFDRMLSFDPDDSLQVPGMQFRPLFFDDKFRATSQTTDDPIDLLMIGTVHTDRYQIVSTIKRSLQVRPDITAVFYLYFPSPIIYRARKIFDPQFWGAKMSEFQFDPLAAAECAALVHRARVILDIERPIQSGLTVRTLESVASSKKLVTTNASIRKYDFYDPQNILIIDRRTPFIPPEFLESEYRPLPPEIVEKYSIQSWLHDVFSLEPVDTNFRVQVTL